MSYKVGRNHERNLANRKGERKYPTLNIVIPHSKKARKIKFITRRKR